MRTVLPAQTLIDLVRCAYSQIKITDKVGKENAEAW
jgi:hypothetical protein